MPTNNLGKITKVDLRKAWKHEASDFTAWLAGKENLQLLSDEVGIDMSLVQTEASVGRYSIDILATEESTGKQIIIENQLEPTNHDHLGKLITYASGSDAKFIIWVVEEAREEHRQAVDWLNEHTEEDIAFFLVRVELWQIGDSPFATKFEIISKPNDWAKSVRQAVTRGSGQLTDTKARQLEFWTQFKAFAEEKKTTLRFQKPAPQHWLNAHIGTKHGCVSLNVNSFDESVRTEFYIWNNKDIFHFLESQKDEVERNVGLKLDWQELPGKQASRIRAEMSGLIDNTDEWEKYFAWMLKTAEKFQETFSTSLKKYKGDE